MAAVAESYRIRLATCFFYFLSKEYGQYLSKADINAITASDPNTIQIVSDRFANGGARCSLGAEKSSLEW